MVYKDKNANKVLHICRHYVLILLMLTFLYQIYSGLFNLEFLKILKLKLEDLFNQWKKQIS